MAVFSYCLSNGKMSFRNRDFHYSLSDVHFAVIPGNTVTVSEKTMKVWPGHMRGHSRSFECHFTSKINSLSSVGDLVVTAGDQVSIFTLEQEASQKFKTIEEALVVYENEIIEDVEPSGALFTAIEDLTVQDGPDLTRPRCEAAPSPIIRDDEEIPDRILDITPMDQSEDEKDHEKVRNCSSPILPKIGLVEIEKTDVTEENKGFVRIVKNCSKSTFPVRSMARPKSTSFDLSYHNMPEEIFPPKSGSEGKVFVNCVRVK